MSDNVTTPLGPVRTTTLYAVVGADGTLRRGVGAVTVGKPQGTAGHYNVTFSVDVSLGCFTTTVVIDSFNKHRFAMVLSPSEDDPATVGVNVTNEKGDSRDEEFCLTVTTAYGPQNMN